MVVDGAGGIEGGTAAADLAVSAIIGSRMIPSLTRQPGYWASTLSLLDGYLYQDAEAGECAVVIAAIVDGFVAGASIGDAGAWLFTRNDDIHLTAGQRVKPLAGSGKAEARAFGPVPFEGTLIAGSDGLFKYATLDAVRNSCIVQPAELLARSLIDLVQLPSGDFHDDAAVAVCRREKP